MKSETDNGRVVWDLLADGEDKSMLILFTFQANVFESSSLTYSSPCILCQCYTWLFSLPNPFPFFYPTCYFARLTDISPQQYQTLALRRTLVVRVSPFNGWPTANRNTNFQNTVVYLELPKPALVILVIPPAPAYRTNGEGEDRRNRGLRQLHQKPLRLDFTDISYMDLPTTIAGQCP